jgi:dTMP kinase
MLVALEGIDGSGKGTQTRRLHERLEAEGFRAARFAFPQYGQTPFSSAIAEYLNGAYGPAAGVHPKLVSVLFAADRFAVRDQLLAALETHDCVLCDRYVASNMAHQGSKLPPAERERFVEWLGCIEYEAFGLPRADLTLFLSMPVEAARQLVLAKPTRAEGQPAAVGGQGGYTDLAEDAHESNPDYLGASREMYELLATRQQGGEWVRVACVESSGALRPAEAVADEVWSVVRPRLAR